MTSMERMPAGNPDNPLNEERNPKVDEWLEALEANDKKQELAPKSLEERLQDQLDRTDLSKEEIRDFALQVEQKAAQIAGLEAKVNAVLVIQREGGAELLVDPETFISEANQQIEALEGEIIDLLDAFEAEHGV